MSPAKGKPMTLDEVRAHRAHLAAHGIHCTSQPITTEPKVTTMRLSLPAKNDAQPTDVEGTPANSGSVDAEKNRKQLDASTKLTEILKALSLPLDTDDKAALAAFADLVKAAGGVRPDGEVEASARLHGLAAREIISCRAKGIDPAKYAAHRAAIKAQSVRR